MIHLMKFVIEREEILHDNEKILVISISPSVTMFSNSLFLGVAKKQNYLI